MTRVFLTGGNGFLGARLAWALQARGDEVHLLLRNGLARERLRDAVTGSPIDAVIHQGDLEDPGSLENALRKASPDLIFHIAAYGAARGDTDPQSLFASNVLAAHHLLEASQGLDVKRIVVTGGSSEYGHHTDALREDTPRRPVSAYGGAKATASLLFERAARNEGRPVVLVRPFSIYGPFEPTVRLIPKAILAGLRGERLPLTREAFVRDFVYVDDVVEGCLLAADVPNIEGQTFNLGTGVETSNHRAIEVIESALGHPIDVEFGDYPAHTSDTHSWRADASKAQLTLGWTARTDLETGVRRTIDFLRKSIDSGTP